MPKNDYSPSLTMRLVSPIASFLLRCLGWTIVGGRINVSKAVLIAAPHTTNWDLFYTLLCSWTIRIPIWFMMKESHFWWPAKLLWKFLGGVPINRSKSSGVVAQMANAFAEREVLYLVIPPEGTRKDVACWKSGFYYVALGANVPVWPWFIDYQAKRIGCGAPIMATGDIDADFKKIRTFYEEMVGPMPHCRPNPS